MSGLHKYEFKNIRVITTDGAIYEGFADVYTSAADNEEAEESIGIITNKREKEGVELFASEIQSIEIVEN